MQIELTPLSNQDEIKAGLKLMTNSNLELENTENFNKCEEFLHPESSKKYTLESAKLFILKKRKSTSR